MESTKNVRWNNPFKKFGMVRVKNKKFFVAKYLAPPTLSSKSGGGITSAFQIFWQTYC